MPRRPDDWLRQARADLESARVLRAAEHYDAASFYGHQAAEKAVKALWESRGVEARGHGLNGLTEPLDMPETTREAAARLNRHYVGARYPNTLPEGAPADSYTGVDADQAIGDAESILAHVEGQLPHA